MRTLAGVLREPAVAVARVPRRPARPIAPGSAVTPARRVQGAASVVAGSASLQAAAALATTVFAVFGSAGTAGLRFCAAAVVLLAWARPALRGRPRSSWLSIAAFGGSMVAASVCLFAALDRLPFGTAVTLQFLGPLSVALAGARRRLDAACAVAALAGVVLLTGGPTGASPTGVAFGLGAAAAVAATILLAARVDAQTDRLEGLALSVAAAALLTMPLSLPAVLATTQPADLARVAAVGVLGIAVPYALFLSAMRRVGARAYSVLLSLDPAVAAVVGVVALSQAPDVAQGAGIAIVVVASATAMSRAPSDGPNPDPRERSRLRW